MMRCSQPSIRSEPSLVGMGSEAGGGTGLMTSPKQRATQKLRPVLPGHPGMLSEWGGNGSTCSVVSICKGRCNQRSGDAVAEAGARLRAGGAYVIPHCGVLAGRAVEVGDGSWAVGPREASGPRRVGA